MKASRIRRLKQNNRHNTVSSLFTSRHHGGHEIPKKQQKRYNGFITAMLILGLRPANEKRRYFVTTSLVDWAQA